jgi:tetratricopeptide (TPR) repeat protein
MNLQILQRILPVLVWLASQSALLSANEPEDPTKEDYRLASAFQNHAAFELAIPHWKEVIAECPDAVRVEKARYHLATCYFYEKQYTKSLNQLNIVLKSNPAKKDPSNSDLRRNGIALMAMNHRQLRNERQVQETLALLRSEFPADEELAKQIQTGKYPLDRGELRATPVTAAPPK